MTRVKGEQLHIPEAQAEPDIPLVVVVTYDEQEEHAIAMPVEASPLTKKKQQAKAKTNNSTTRIVTMIVMTTVSFNNAFARRRIFSKLKIPMYVVLLFHAHVHPITRFRLYGMWRHQSASHQPWLQLFHVHLWEYLH
jgi:hypothetical protein